MISSANHFPLVTTFHGLCWQVLKEIIADRRAAIVTESARRILLADAIRQIGRTDADHSSLSLDDMMECIVCAKQRLLGPQDDLSALVPEPRRPFVVAVYQSYQNILALQNLFDFEDLIFLVVRRLWSDEYWRNRMQNRFQYIFIDEFQDINLSQYRLIEALAPPPVNLCVIGDPDQAIYGFRGSDWRFFERFAEDHPGSLKVFLNQNYRSTDTILAASYQVLRCQPSLPDGGERHVFSGIQGIDAISVYESASAKAEAVIIGKTIEKLMGGIGFHSVDFGKTDPDCQIERSFSDFAILYRTNAQGSLMAQVLSHAGIPCQVTDQHAFQQKPLVAKISAILRFMADHACYADLHWVLDIVSPALAERTVQAFKDWAYAQKLPLLQGLRNAARFPVPGISVSDQHRLVSLLQLLQGMIDDAVGLSVVERITLILDRISPRSSAQEDETLKQLLMQAQSYGHQLDYYLACQATKSDTDMLAVQTEKVALLTMHAAKGLEFPIVFIAGCEDGLIPYRHPSSALTDIEEERRLFFVAMTRARRQLIISWARRRHLYGRTLVREPSPFLADIEKAKMETNLNLIVKQRQLSLF